MCIRDSGDGRIDDGHFTICLNTDPYTYLGNLPLNLAPEATLERGLAAVTLRSLRSSHLLKIVLDAFRPPAGIEANKHLDIRTDLAGAKLHARHPVPVQVDGDFIGTFSQLEFQHHPNVLRLARTDVLQPKPGR